MKKFVVQSKKGITSITEVEISALSSLEDPSVMWLKPGEYMACVLQPTSFHQKIEKTVEGKSEITMVPVIWHSHSFHDSLEQAIEYSNKLIKHEFEFGLTKYNKQYTEEDVQAAIAAVEVCLLKA